MKKNNSDAEHRIAEKTQVELYMKIRDGLATDEEKELYEALKSTSCMCDFLYESVIKNSPYYIERA